MTVLIRFVYPPSLSSESVQTTTEFRLRKNPFWWKISSTPQHWSKKQQIFLIGCNRLQGNRRVFNFKCYFRIKIKKLCKILFTFWRERDRSQRHLLVCRAIECFLVWKRIFSFLRFQLKHSCFKFKTHCEWIAFFCWTRHSSEPQKTIKFSILQDSNYYSIST